MKQPIKIGACLLFAAVAATLAGCGSHDQNTTGTSSGQGTPPEIVQQAKQNQQAMQNHPPPNAQGAPAAPATH